jgi:Tfp pilus assembly protein FimV
MREHDAVKAAAEYREADLTDDYVRYQLALALEASGHAEDARRLFREVAEWNFNSVGFALSRRDAIRRGGVVTMR